MTGVDVKSLVGMPELVSPSAYQIKKAVQQLKALAMRHPDPEFRMMALRALADEQETLAKRFGRVAVA